MTCPLETDEFGGFHSMKTNIFAPENGWLEYFLVSFWDSAYFQGQAVSFRECTGFEILNQQGSTNANVW